MKLLGIDYGEKRVGVAASDEDGKMAFPYGVFGNDKSLINKIVNLIDTYDAGVVVIGKSLDYKGQPNTVMAKIEKFKQKLESDTDTKIVYEDEYLTTKQAEHIQGKNDQIDASAATIILQSYIDKTNR